MILDSKQINRLQIPLQKGKLVQHNDTKIQHVLPKGFRRVRDYGFLHGNAKKLLFLVQLILHVVIKGIK